MAPTGAPVEWASPKAKMPPSDPPPSSRRWRHRPRWPRPAGSAADRHRAVERRVAEGEDAAVPPTAGSVRLPASSCTYPTRLVNGDGVPCLSYRRDIAPLRSSRTANISSPFTLRRFVIAARPSNPDRDVSSSAAGRMTPRSPTFGSPNPWLHRNEPTEVVDRGAKDVES